MAQKYERKTVGLLFAGGTALGPKPVRGSIVTSPKVVNQWLKKVREFRVLADVKPFFIYGGEAANITPEHWKAIAETIAEHADRFDGFVVTHGIDTIDTTAIALSFALQDLPCPVILTGSPVPDPGLRLQKIMSNLFTGYHGLGITANLINAVQVALSAKPGVAVMFGNQLIAGAQIIRSPAGVLQPFSSQSGSVLGKVDFGVRLEMKRSGESAKRLKPLAAFDTNITVFDYQPNVSLGPIEQAITKRASGIFVRTHKTPYFPTELYDLMRRATDEEKIPVVIFSEGGETRSQEQRFTVIAGLSFSAAVIKFMWVLGQTKRKKDIRRLLAQNLVGEIQKPLRQEEVA